MKAKPIPFAALLNNIVDEALEGPLHSAFFLVPSHTICTQP